MAQGEWVTHPPLWPHHSPYSSLQGLDNHAHAAILVTPLVSWASPGK